MICPSCGAQNHSDFSFCLQCGHPLSQGGDQAEPTRADLLGAEAGTMAMPGLSASGAPGGTARLRVDQGSVDDPFIDLDRPLTVIGRRQGSDIVIHDTNVSRMHAQIKRDGSRLLIEDTNSSNGTIVNDERIERPTQLRAGDVIRIGDAVFIFEEQEPADMPSEGSTMAIDIDSPMTSLGGPPELIPPGMMPQSSPLTPPPPIMDPIHTSVADSFGFEDDLSPPPARSSSSPAPGPNPSSSSPSPSPVSPAYGSPAPPASPPYGSSAPASPAYASPAPASPAYGSPAPSLASSPASRPAASSSSASGSGSGSTAAALESLRHELTDVGHELSSFSGTLGGLADRVERLERALDAATGDLASVADAIRGPDAGVLKELQGILSDIQRLGEGPSLDDAVKVLEQLSAQPRDIELLLKLSQQASSIESALRIHGRLVAAAPQLRTTLARLTG